jgi:hypothetical protein
MSNTKEFWIEGSMPFNVYEDQKSTGWLGFMNAPSIGIHIHYSSEYKVPIPGKNGKLTMYYFTISGQEAMRYDAIMEMVKDFKAAGAVVTKFMLRDMDDNGSWEKFPTD